MLAVSDLKVDKIALNETRLTRRLTLRVPGFSCYRSDCRPDGSGQGVAILVRADLEHSLVSTPPTQNLEAIGISLKLSSGINTIYSVYQSPNKTLLPSDIGALMSSGNQILMMGDLNARHPYWSPGPINTHGKTIFDLMMSDELTVFSPSEPTLVHYNGESLPTNPDLLITKNISAVES